MPRRLDELFWGGNADPLTSFYTCTPLACMLPFIKTSSKTGVIDGEGPLDRDKALETDLDLFNGSYLWGGGEREGREGR